ncbi:MAG: hypothetical protein ABI615_00435 [Chthoniobacterales bacterium]
MKIIRILSKLVLYVVLTFVFIIIFEHGTQITPAKVVNEYQLLKQEVETIISKR